MDNTATPKRAIRFKLMPDGQIRGFRPNSTDKAGASEWQITPPYCIARTITAVHCSKILITDESIYNALRRANTR